MLCLLEILGSCFFFMKLFLCHSRFFITFAFSVSLAKDFIVSYFLIEIHELIFRTKILIKQYERYF